MPRNGSGVMSKPAGTTAAPNTTIESAKYNATIDDIIQDLNYARPVVAGGTGGATAIAGGDNLSTKGADIASAATTDIGAATGRYVHINGTTTITSLGTKTAGVLRIVTFDGVLTLTYNAASLILPGGADIVTGAGDVAVFISEGGGNWRCVSYTRSLGQLGGFRNKLINADGRVNQRSYVSGAATTGANQYTLDRWRVVTSGQNLAFAASGNVYTLTAPSGGLEQVIEGANIEGGTYVLNWSGTATATVNGTTRAKGEAFTLTANTNATVRFASGTVTRPQLELGSVTAFDQRPPGVELALCQRYYTRFIGLFIQGYNATGTNITQTLMRPVAMRAAPSNAILNTVGNNNINAVNVVGSSAAFAHVGATISSTGNGNISYDLTSDAEL